MKVKELKIGDKLALYDSTRRFYDKSKECSSPIYSRHFTEAEVTSETSRSVIIDNKYKIAKNKELPIQIDAWHTVMTESQKQEDIWKTENVSRIRRMLDHRYKISQKQWEAIEQILNNP